MGVEGQGAQRESKGGAREEQGSCSGKQQLGLTGLDGLGLAGWADLCSDSGLAEPSALSAGMCATQVLRTSQTARTALICHEWPPKAQLLSIARPRRRRLGMGL
jgi:hypothetical protein